MRMICTGIAARSAIPRLSILLTLVNAQLLHFLCNAPLSASTLCPQDTGVIIQSLKTCPSV